MNLDTVQSKLLVLVVMIALSYALAYGITKILSREKQRPMVTQSIFSLVLLATVLSWSYFFL
jgi:hypothetical protein